tara:strand:- start:11533 stop:12462 length:930 start_codon:yes stop_codon:yes gene_type:complete
MQKGLNYILSIIAKWLDISYAKRRKIIPDGSTAASMQQMFAPEISSHLAIMDISYSWACPKVFGPVQAVFIFIGYNSPIRLKENNMKAITSLLVASVATFAIAGCATHTTDPYTGERQMNKTTKYGLIGAATCAAGAMIDGSNKNKAEKVAASAAICGAAGAAVGAYVDRQHAKLRQQLQSTGVSVTRQGDVLILNMPGNITFDTGSAGLKASFYQTLNSIVLVLKEFDKTSIEVIGHTDSVGSDTSNQVLSEKRAFAVQHYLNTQGIAPARTRAYGVGEQYPIADNNSPAGREMNRRVEMRLLPPQQL